MLKELLKTTPYTFQSKAAKLALANAGVALFMDMGTGKTLTSLYVAVKRYLKGEVVVCLILCPKSAVGVWVREIRKHLGLWPRVVTGWEEFDPYRLDYRKGKDKRLIFVILNYEHYPRRINKMIRETYDMIVADEAHKLRKHSSAQSRAAARLAKKSKFRIALTGTPVGKNELDLFGIFKFVDNRLFGTSFSEFAEQHTVPSGFMGMVKKLTKSSRKWMLRQIKPITFRVDKDDVLDLPDEIPPVHYYFELDPKHRKIYDQMQEEELVQLENKATISGELAITTAIKLHQMAGGWVKDDDGEVHQVGTSKLNLLEEIVKERPWNNKVLIVTLFKPEMEHISKMLKRVGIKHVQLYGGSELSASQVERKFENDPSIEAAVIQVQSGAESLDFTQGDMTIFYSLTRSYIQYQQVKARTRRNGQTRKTSYLYLLSKNTIDEHILNDLQDTHELAVTVNRLLKKRKKKRTKK